MRHGLLLMLFLAPAGCFPTTSQCQPATAEAGSGEVLVTCGGFAMGDFSGNGQLVQSFLMDRTQVTADEYAACVGSGGCAPVEGTLHPERGCTPDVGKKPIYCVSLDDAQTFCASRHKRLPTEIQWEYAARGQGGSRYPWGEEPSPDGLFGCWGHMDACIVDSFGPGRRTLLGKLDPNGLADQGANVWEWTSSFYCPYPLPSQGCSTDRVVRGGAWFDDSVKLGPLSEAERAIKRHPVAPDFIDNGLGFRCARDAI